MFLPFFTLERMKHTIQEIIDNQENFKNEILRYFSSEVKEARKDLYEIESEDELIKKEVEKMKSKFSKTKFRKGFDKLFFMHPNRNKTKYAWWDKEKEEALILSYEKR